MIINLVANITKGNVQNNVRPAWNFFLADFVMMKQNIKMNLIPKKIIKSIAIILKESDAMNVLQNKPPNKIANHVKLNLLDTFAQSVIFLMTTILQKKYFIVMGAVSAESEAGKTSSIAIHVVAVYLML